MFYAWRSVTSSVTVLEAQIDNIVCVLYNRDWKSGKIEKGYQKKVVVKLL